jgi:DtxR family transcriptional regulator, manganese transport regulator
MSSSASNQGRSHADASRRFQRTRDDHATELAEDYVELIADLIDQTGEARTVDIAARLGVTHVTVTNTINRLKRDGLVTSEPYRSIFLTDNGRQLAAAARVRHDLVLRFLIALGVPAADAEIDAEGIEHHIGESTVTAMERFVTNAK